MGQVRVFSTHFENNKGQKVKLKGHQYSFLAALRVFIRITSTHFWHSKGFFKGRSSTCLQPLINAKEIDLQMKIRSSNLEVGLRLLGAGFDSGMGQTIGRQENLFITTKL